MIKKRDHDLKKFELKQNTYASSPTVLVLGSVRYQSFTLSHQYASETVEAQKPFRRRS